MFVKTRQLKTNKIYKRAVKLSNEEFLYGEPFFVLEKIIPSGPKIFLFKVLTKEGIEYYYFLVKAEFEITS